ncbi:hypothetical protein [Absidia glauca]|uniref:Uncharacterized protein n=1 Tax=Absidia glauca TaxID=4829 RepID=A0A168T622_ABSGL|nr:hypothetical protein [Absidia glauca]
MMTLDDQIALQYDWWESVQQFDVPKVQELYTAHPHLVWLKIVDPAFLPKISDSFLPPNFTHDLGPSLDNLNTLQWLLFYYNSSDHAKTLTHYILDKSTTKELNADELVGWGDKNNTTLHLVSALGYEDLAVRLIQKGVRTDIANAQGYLPVNVAQTDSMVTLLDTNNNKVDDIRPDSGEPNRSQSTQQLTKTSISPSTSSSSSSSSTAAAILKTPNKDQHYFRLGHVEQTKQKVLTDEQVELEKHRERRRKDIAILAKRSAVKNNPFVKNAEPTHTSSGTIRLRHDTSTPSTTATLDTTPDDVTPDSSLLGLRSVDKKHKRNSKVINSLQTKSYVSSSIFRQGQPALAPRSKRPNLASLQQQDHQDPPPSEVDTHNAIEIPISPSSPVTIQSTDPSPVSSPVLSSPPPNVPDAPNAPMGTETAGSMDSETHHDIEDDGPSSPSSTKAEQQEPSSPIGSKMDHQQSRSTPTTRSAPISSVNADSSSDHTAQPELSTKTEISDTEMQSMEAASLNTKRQSGSQKTNWAKELTSWESVLNREFSLDNIDKIHSNQSPTSPTSLGSDSDSATASLPVGGGDEDDIDPDSDQQEQPRRNADDDERQRRRQGADNTIFEGSRLPLKSYGSVSVRSMATYTRRLPTPTFDTTTISTTVTSPTTATAKMDESPITLSQTAISGAMTTATPTLLTQPNYTDRRITRSISVSDLSPSPAKDSRHHTEQQKQHQHPSRQHRSPPPRQESSIPLPPPSFNLSNCGRGKLYIRVHGVHDILLPLPRDRAHVRCVIGDGRYEYMSRYETLAQDITFGYECIIDSHPDMIVTLSLHVRPDYMLKKPLTRLFSSNRKRKGSLSAYVSNEDGAVGQTRFAVGDMLAACHRRSYSASFHCFNAWYVHAKPASNSSSSLSLRQDADQGVLKVVGNFKVEMLYLPVSDPALPVPKNLREIDMAIKIQQWNETRFDNDIPKIQRPPPRVA